jgi:hypothetical protein
MPSMSSTSAALALALGLGLWAAVPSRAQALHACRLVPDTLKVDGILDDAAWKGLDTLALVRNDAPAGGASAVRTRALLAWTPTRLLIAFIAHSRNVKGTLARRDDPLYSQDAVELFVDPGGDGKDYLELEWNCLNTVLDLRLAGPRTGQDVGWTAAGMRSAVKVLGTANNPGDVDSAWVTEISLPWSDLAPWSQGGLPPEIGDGLPLNLYRIDNPAGQPQELLAWSPTGVPDFHRPEKFGRVTFAGAVGSRIFALERQRPEWPQEVGQGRFFRVDGREVLVLSRPAHRRNRPQPLP